MLYQLSYARARPQCTGESHSFRGWRKGLCAPRMRDSRRPAARRDLHSDHGGSAVKRFVSRNEQGQTMAEYSVILGVISVAVVAAFLVFAGSVPRPFLRVAQLFF